MLLLKPSQIIVAIGCALLTKASPGGVPFIVEASEDVRGRFPGAPHLQSFAWGQWDGKWVFIAGRTGGYHGVGGAEADFPRNGANTKIWVVDPTGTGPARTYSLPISILPESLAAVRDQWMSSNILFFQDGETLYLAGGYGENLAGAWVTYPVLSAVHLPSLVESVMRGRDTFLHSIAYTSSPLVQVAGGELLKLDDGMFYIAGGHVFTGTYREFETAEEKNTSHVSQKYTGEIRKLAFKRDENGKLSVALIDRYENPEFARRDLNAAFTIAPDGHTLGAAVYGGVFTKDQLSFSRPIYWSASTRPKVDDQFEQKMSAYTCAKLLLFDADLRTMYTTFFGGISRWKWNYEQERFESLHSPGIKRNPCTSMAWNGLITSRLWCAGSMRPTKRCSKIKGWRLIWGPIRHSFPHPISRRFVRTRMCLTCVRCEASGCWWVSLWGNSGVPKRISLSRRLPALQRGKRSDKDERYDNRGLCYGAVVELGVGLIAPASRAWRISSQERSFNPSQARATNPVILATAKLMPFKLRSRGMPGSERGNPDAEKT